MVYSVSFSAGWGLLEFPRLQVHPVYMEEEREEGSEEEEEKRKEKEEGRKGRERGKDKKERGRKEVKREGE